MFPGAIRRVGYLRAGSVEPRTEPVSTVNLLCEHRNGQTVILGQFQQVTRLCKFLRSVILTAFPNYNRENFAGLACDYQNAIQLSLYFLDRPAGFVP